MNLFKNLAFISLFFIGNIIGYHAFAYEASNTDDLLNQAFDLSIRNERVVGNQLGGNTKEWVGNWLLKGTDVYDMGKIIKDGVHAEVEKKPSFVGNVAIFLVRFTLVLAITMIIYNGVIFVIKSSKGELAKDSLKNIAYIAVGVLLALTSVVIIRIASSIGNTSLNIGKKNISYNYSNTTFTYHNTNV